MLKRFAPYLSGMFLISLVYVTKVRTSRRPPARPKADQ